MPREISERVIRRVDLESLGPVVAPEPGPGLVVMSAETYQTLFPLLGENVFDVTRTADGLIHHFRWGGRDVVVFPSRDFTALPAGLGRVNHLYSVVERARREFEAVEPVSDEPVLVLAAGWRSTGMDELAALAQRSGTPLGSATTVPGATAVYLDWAAYARALGMEGTP